MLTQKYKYIYILIFLLASVFYSCQRSEVYFRYQELKGAKWIQKESLLFEIDSTLIDIGQSYDISIYVDNNVSYLYQDLWLQIDTDFSGESNLERVEKKCIVANDKGRWDGHGAVFIYSTSLIFRQAVRFKEKKNYKMYIRHGLKDSILVGVERVGVRLNRN